jgi:hypothetical protein
MAIKNFTTEITEDTEINLRLKSINYPFTFSVFSALSGSPFWVLCG